MTFVANAPSETIGNKSAGLLGRQLAGALDLHGKVERIRHVMSPEWAPIRKLLREVAEALESYSEKMSNRATAGGGAGAAHWVVVDRPRLSATQETADEAEIDALAADLAAFGDASRGAIDEAAASGDFEACAIFTGLSREIDYDLWLLQSLSQPLFARPYRLNIRLFDRRQRRPAAARPPGRASRKVSRRQQETSDAEQHRLRPLLAW
jgi:DNA-binding ferritin-like protein